MPAIIGLRALGCHSERTLLSKLHAIAKSLWRMTKVHFLRICTDNEINVVVKPEQVCLEDDRYTNLEGML